MYLEFAEWHSLGLTLRDIRINCVPLRIAAYIKHNLSKFPVFGQCPLHSFLSLSPFDFCIDFAASFSFLSFSRTIVGRLVRPSVTSLAVAAVFLLWPLERGRRARFLSPYVIDYNIFALSRATLSFLSLCRRSRRRRSSSSVDVLWLLTFIYHATLSESFSLFA